MDALPLEHVFRRDGVELGFDEGVRALILPGDLRLVHGRADDEVALEGLLQRSGSMRGSGGA